MAYTQKGECRNTGKTWIKMGAKLSKETREKISKHSAKYWSGKKFSKEHIMKLSKSHLGKTSYWFGKKRPEMSGKNNYFYGKNLSGEKAWNWKGDSVKKKDERNDPAYKQWRLKVLNRDDYRCLDCGEIKKGKMESDHIYSWREYQRLRYEIDNGQCLCAECHLVKTKAQLRGDYKLIFNY